MQPAMSTCPDGAAAGSTSTRPMRWRATDVFLAGAFDQSSQSVFDRLRFSGELRRLPSARGGGLTASTGARTFARSSVSRRRRQQRRGRRRQGGQPALALPRRTPTSTPSPRSAPMRRNGRRQLRRVQRHIDGDAARRGHRRAREGRRARVAPPRRWSRHIKAGAKPLPSLAGRTVTGGTADAAGALAAALGRPTRRRLELARARRRPHRPGARPTTTTTAGRPGPAGFGRRFAVDRRGRLRMRIAGEARLAGVVSLSATRKALARAARAHRARSLQPRRAWSRHRAPAR